MTINAYPLTWPEGWKRTRADFREVAKFSTKARSNHRQPISVYDGVERVLEELERIGVRRDDLVISTNLILRMDGLPRSDQRNPDDPGASVWWETKKDRKVMAIDRYTRVADNLAAIAATLEAMRAIERHGGAAILDRAFTGFTALPSQSAVKGWREMLFPNGCPADVTLAMVQRNYRQLASQHHPDKGGSTDMMTAINHAWEQAQQELSQ